MEKKHYLRSIQFFICFSVFILLSCTLIRVGKSSVTNISSMFPGHHFFVSPSGNDNWSGRAEKIESNQSDGPFLTIDRAKEAVRDFRQKNQGKLDKPIYVFIREGTYKLPKPLVFNSEDSGTAKSPIIYRSYPGEEAQIIGGEGLYGWQKLSRNDPNWNKIKPNVRAKVWTVLAEDNKMANCQLWDPSGSLTRARYPNDGYILVAKRPDPSKRWNIGHNRFSFEMEDFDVNKSGKLENEEKPWLWSTLTDGNVILFQRWNFSRLQFRQNNPVDAKTFTFNFRNYSQYSIEPKTSKGKNHIAYYHIEHVLEQLDLPGEWFFDKKSKRFYLYPQVKIPNKNDLDGQIFTPRLSKLISLQGDLQNEKYVSHIAFEDVNLKYSSWCELPWTKQVNKKKRKIGGTNKSQNVPGAIYIKGGRNLRFKDNSFTQLGQFAISIFGTGNQDISITNNRFDDLGAGAVNVNYMDEYIKKFDGDANTKIQIKNNKISNGAKFFWDANAIALWRGNSYLIENNEISGFNIGGIELHGLGHFPKDSGNNLIKGNHIYNIGGNKAIPYLNDKGAIHTFGAHPSTKIVDNIIHDIYSFGSSNSGIYLDEAARNVDILGNTIHSVPNAGLFFHALSGPVLVRGNNVDSRLAIYANLYRWCSKTDLRIENNVFKTRGNNIIRRNFCSELGANFSKSFRFSGNKYIVPKDCNQANFILTKDKQKTWKDWIRDFEPNASCRIEKE